MLNQTKNGRRTLSFEGVGGDEIIELTDIDKEHIAKMIVDGCNQGEIIQEYIQEEEAIQEEFKNQSFFHFEAIV